MLTSVRPTTARRGLVRLRSDGPITPCDSQNIYERRYTKALVAEGDEVLAPGNPRVLPPRLEPRSSYHSTYDPPAPPPSPPPARWDGRSGTASPLPVFLPHPGTGGPPALPSNYNPHGAVPPAHAAAPSGFRPYAPAVAYPVAGPSSHSLHTPLGVRPQSPERYTPLQKLHNELGKFKLTHVVSYAQGHGGWIAVISIAGRNYGRGWGTTKKAAEQEAALMALESIGLAYP